MGKRVLITGVSTFLGLRLAKRLEHDDSIDHLVGVDLNEPPVPIEGLEFIRVDIRNPLIARVLEATKVDTLVHTNIASNPARAGGRSQMKENNVIGTMQLLAAAQRAERIEKVVMKSSSAIYGYAPGDPSILPEVHAGRHDLSGYAKDCAEAEQYARDFGRRRRDVSLTILRTQNVLGPTVKTSLGQYFALPVVPTALGFDPRLQFLHEQDAVEALYLAMTEDDVSGIFNVAADGVVYLSKALRLLGKRELPLVLPLGQLAASTLRRLKLVDFPTDQLNLIVYGRVVSTMRAKERLGFSPAYTTEDTLLDFHLHREGEADPVPNDRPAWERELFEYLRGREAQGVRT
ncbi:MAG TPA: NAD-dependent epimerase/dehydratase family protein [Actinomycetota bacterium]|nr:NAD-dependent epimerase/dehydratase family protein [Actinomycetota bacterium]